MMSNAVSVVIGNVVADAVRAELMKSKSKPSIRLQDFVQDEITVIASSLSGFKLRGASEPVKVVVAAKQAWEGLSQEFLLAPGETLTWYRNRNVSGIVLIEAEPQGDAQGLRNMFTLSDRTVLSAAAHDEQGFSTIVARAWAAHQGAAGLELPASLVKVLREVFDGLEQLSLRSWIGFLHDIASKLAGSGRAVDDSTMSAVVGRALPKLELFADPDLPTTSTNELRRRIVRNYQVSRLRNMVGKELNDDDLARRIEGVRLRDTSGVVLSAEAADPIKRAMRDFVDPARPRDFASILYAQWAQLFDSAAEVTLGALVRQTLATRAPHLVEEFDSMEVQVALDQEDAEAAEQVLKTSVPQGLTRPLVRKLEKIAVGVARSADDPLRELLARIEAIHRTEEAGYVDVVIENAEDSGGASRSLFWFLYGPTLQAVAKSSVDGLGWRLDVPAPASTKIVFPKPSGGDGEDGDESDADEVGTAGSPWAPIRIIVRLRKEPNDSPRVMARFEWRAEEHPGLVAMSRWIQETAHLSGFHTDATLDAWCARSLEGPIGAGGVTVEPKASAGPTARWLALRSEAFGRLTESGMASDELDQYIQAWAELLEEVRSEHVPHGSSEDELDNFLRIDTLTVAGQRAVLSATHPIRLRWFASYVGYMARQLGRVLERGLKLNAVNDDFYFERLEQMSPHRQPPFVCLDGSTLSIASRELDGFEEYAAIRKERAPSKEWVSELDDASVDAVAGVVRGYLDAYPHKRDGLSLVVFLRDRATRVVERLVSRVRSREYVDVAIDVHVFAPPAHHFGIAEALAKFDSEEERAVSMLPLVRTIIHDWVDTDEPPDLSPVADGVDLAIVPNLFGTSAFAQEKTRDTTSQGSFNPILDRPEHIERILSTEQSENVSRVLLPSRGHDDVILESWSTLNVWRLRNEPVASEGGRKTDFVTIQVRFDKSSDFFVKLHDVAHWVVTLDPFVGRDQIEALDNRPDVITVKPGIGKNEMYTLVVSSSSGEKFIVSRLARRLSIGLKILPEDSAVTVAGGLYRMARHLAPGVILRSLGLGQTVQEIIGLLVARRALEEADPPPTGLRFEAWLSLDEHMEWFGGPQNLRADLVRLRGRRTDGGPLAIDVDILESKFREREEIGRAEDQVRRTVALFENALFKGKDGYADDAEFWRREIFLAIEQGAKPFVAKGGEDPPAENYFAVAAFEDGKPVPHLADVDRAAFREGDYEKGHVRATICGISHGVAKPSERSTVTSEGFRILRVGSVELNHLLSALFAIANGTEPPPPSPVSTPSQAAPDVEARTTDGTDEAADAPEVGMIGAAPRTDGTKEPAAIPAAEVKVRRGLGPLGIEQRYQSVLDALTEFGVKVKRVEQDATIEGPGFYLVRVVPDRGVAPDAVMGKTAELKLRLQLGQEQTPRSYISNGTVVFEIPKHDSERYGVDAGELWASTQWNREKLFAPVGEDVSGNAIGIEFSSSDTPHLLIAGTTGSGKSVALETILGGLCRSHPPERLQLVLVDPKGTELLDFEADPHLFGRIGFDAEDAKQYLADAVEEMQRRYELLKAKRVRNLVDYNRLPDVTPMPWRLIVLDEYADLTSDKEDRKAIEDSLKRLAQKARACGIHLIVATQKPSAEIISTSVRSNLPVQLALRVKTSTDSRIIMDETGAEALAGKGDALLKTAKGVIRVQCALRKT